MPSYIIFMIAANRSDHAGLKWYSTGVKAIMAAVCL